MPAPISVIIPTLNAAPALGPTLAVLVEGLEAGLIRELILSDGGSHDAIAGVAEAAGAKLLCGAASRGGQLRRGAEAAKGDWLLFLHADTGLSPGWASDVTRHLQAGPELAACFSLRFRASGLAPRIVAGWANLRTRMFSLPYGDQGLLVSRRLYDSVGGFRDMPLMEDVAIARALRGRIRLLSATGSTDASRYQADGWFRRGAFNLSTLIRYFQGIEPAELAARYNRR